MSDLMSFKYNMDQVGVPFPSSPSIVGLQARQPVQMELQEGYAITIRGVSASNTGTVNSPYGLQSYSLGAGASIQVGPFAGRQKIVIVGTLGSIDATVGDAVLNLPTATSRYRLAELSNRHFRKPTGKWSAAANVADWTHNVLAAADQSFEWVRVWVANADTVNSILNVSGLIAATETAADLIHPILNAMQDNTVQPVGALTGWNALTWDGGAATTTVPAASVPVSGTIAVNYKASDWIRRRNVPRVDGGVLPLAIARVRTPATSVSMTLTATMTTGWAPASGRIYKMSRQSVDGITTPANYTTTGEGSTCAIAGIEFRGSLPSCPVLCIGDSTYEGFGLTPPQGNWGFQATDNLAQVGYLVSLVQAGWVGAVSTDYYNAGKDFVTKFKPAIVFYEVGSSNDGALTQVQIDRMFAQAVDFSDHCTSNGSVCVFTTMIPNNSTNAGTDALRLQLNARILATKNPVVDFGSVLSDDATPQRIQVALSQGDGTPHPSAAGHAAMAAAAQAMILRIINSNAGAFA